MIWILFYLYVIGVVNDFMFAITAGADLGDWKTHVSIALWPLTVPAAIIIAFWPGQSLED